MKEEFVFTPENLLENIDKLGGWSLYGLASEALAHYFPDKYDSETGEGPDVHEEVELCDQLGCKYWQDLVIKYHKEVGYKGEFNPDCVNEY